MHGYRGPDRNMDMQTDTHRQTDAHRNTHMHLDSNFKTGTVSLGAEKLDEEKQEIF